MFEGHDQAVFDLLAERRLVEPASLQAAFDEHRATGKPLACTLLDLGLVAKPVLLRAVAEHTGWDYTEELPATLPGDALALVEGSLARTYGVAPLAADGFSVSVAAVDPFYPSLVSDLSFALERDVRVSVADPDGCNCSSGSTTVRRRFLSMPHSMTCRHRRTILMGRH
jgi:type IV pilus assembly protein PilB